MAQTDCWLNNETVLREFKGFFDDVNQRFSQFYEEQFDTNEIALDGNLGNYLRSEEILGLHLKRINRERNRTNYPSLSLACRHITHGEGTHGADLGLILRLNLPNEQILDKAVLIQSKRLYIDSNREFSDKSEYRELFGRIQNRNAESNNRLPPQWDRMLNQTSSSVYFLYGPEKFLYKNCSFTQRKR